MGSAYNRDDYNIGHQLKSEQNWRYMSNFTYVRPAGQSKEFRHIHDFNVKKLVLTIINLARTTMH